MSIVIGSAGINKIYLGSDEIKKVYLGNDIIYTSELPSFFEFTVKTDNIGSSSDNQFRLPLVSSSTVDCTVDWGDGIVNTVTSYIDPNATHTYSVIGTYTIKISGIINGWQLNNTLDDRKILDISNWGPFENTEQYAFYGAQDMGITATDAPTLVGTDKLKGMFRNATSVKMGTLDFTNWDFSEQEQLQYMMRTAYYSNPKGLDSIDTSSVWNFFGVFQGVWQVNQSFASWNIEAGTSFGAFMSSSPGLESKNYDLTLASWGSQNVSLDELIDFGNAQYTPGGAGEVGRNQLIAKGWTVRDGGPVTLSRTKNIDMADGLDQWTDRNAVWSPKYFGSAYLDYVPGVVGAPRVYQGYVGQKGVFYKISFDLLENNGCTNFRLYDGITLKTVPNLRLGRNTMFVKWLGPSVFVYYENTTNGSNVYIKNCTMHEAKYGPDIFNTGDITNFSGAIATYVPGGVNVVSDGTGTTFLRPKITWDNLIIGSTYKVDLTYSMNSGDEPGWSLYNGTNYEIQNETITDSSFIFEAKGTNLFMAWDGEQTFDLDAQVTLTEVLLNLDTERITNGNFTTDLNDWTLEQTTWQSTYGGSAVMDRIAPGGCRMYQGVEMIPGSTYRLVYTIEEVSGGASLNYYNGSGFQPITSSVGTYQIEYVQLGVANNFFFFRNNTIGGRLVISNVSIKEILSDFGQNVITNGDFITDTDWTKGSGWSINTSTGEAECDGTQTGTSVLQQAGALEIGTTYKVTYTISNYVSGLVWTRLGYGAQSLAKSANGTYSEEVICSGNTNFDVFATVGFEGNISWVSVKEVGKGVNDREVLAFPTAIGAGASLTGGRGKPVYKVTNLNDSGTGSLRQALEDTKITDGGHIVFNVSGVINLTSNLYPAGIKNVTISGQTAPEGGITIGNYPMGFFSLTSNTIPSENIIIRYVKFRPDSFAALPIQIDVLDMQYVDGYIVDHCSISFGTDEAAHHGWYENFTWQNNLIAENSKGMIMGQIDRGEGNFSFNKNVIYNTSHRFPNIESGGRVDLINNLVWSFHSRMSRSRGSYSINQIGNYYVCDPNDDPANPDRRWNHIQAETYGYPTGVHTNGNYFFDGNSLLLDGNSSNDDYNTLWFDGVGSTPLPSQYENNASFVQLGKAFVPLTATEVKSQLPDDCGAVRRLAADGSVISDIDSLDSLYINNIKNDIHTGWIYTGDQTSGKINDNNSSVHYNDFQNSITGIPINSHDVNYDTNGDGIPDAWKILKGFSINDDLESYEWPSGYIGIEEYLNEVDN